MNYGQQRSAKQKAFENKVCDFFVEDIRTALVQLYLCSILVDKENSLEARRVYTSSTSSANSIT